MQTHFRITNLSCEACVKLSTQALREIQDVENIHIDIQTGNTFIEAPEKIPFETIKTTLAEVGKEVEIIL